MKWRGYSLSYGCTNLIKNDLSVNVRHYNSLNFNTAKVPLRFCKSNTKSHKEVLFYPNSRAICAVFF